MAEHLFKLDLRETQNGGIICPVGFEFLLCPEAPKEVNEFKCISFCHISLKTVHLNR